MRELQLRQALACSKSFLVFASSILITLCTSIAVLAQCDPDEGSSKYTVFIDSKSDSTFSAGEFGIANDIVAVHDAESKLIEFAMFYGIDISGQNIDSTLLEFQSNHNGIKENSITYESADFEQDIGTEDQELAMMPLITSDVTSECECTDAVAGFFTNEVTITSKDGQKWYVDQAIGAFDTTSTDGNLVTFVTGMMGDSLTQIGVVGIDDNYVLRFYSLDGNPWQLSLRNEQDNFVVIQGAACDNTIISVSGESALCIGTTEVYSVTNPTAGDSYTFSLPPASGTMTIISAISAQVEWSVNGGPFQLSVSNTGTNIDCQSTTIVGGQGVMVGTADGPLSCIGHTNASLNEWCELLVKPSTISSQSLDPLVPYSIMLTLPNGTIVPDNILTGEHIGLLVEAKLIEGCGNNACWGTITVEDNLGPVFNCVETEVFCFNLDEYGGPLALDACDGPIEVEYSSQETVNLPNDQEFVNKIIRTYIAEDSKGNTATPCVVEIYVKRLKFDDITWPDDIIGEDALICSDIDESGIPPLEISKVPTVFGYPLLPAQDNICDFTLIYEDKEEIGFGCITTVLREYTAIFWDPLSNTYATDSYTQVIEVEDDNDPIFQPLDDIEVTSGFDNCTKEVTILYPEGLDDQCSDIDQIDITWTPIESITIGGSLQNVDFPVDIVMPLGESLVTYRAYDECNNSSTASITVIINPNTGPTASCKDMNVALGSGNGGFAYVPATSIDKSNSPLCGSIVSSHVRRLDEGANCYIDPVTGENVSATEFGDYVIFCCEDAGKTIMVELQIIDNYGGIGLCISMITVQDSNAPTISTLPNDTIECGTLFTTEQLDLLNDTDPDNDVDLSQFGFPIIDDECGNADTEFTTIWVPTIVGCGTGTIVRTFTASDSNNTTSTSQTITVTKESFQDSYIEQFEVLDTNICDLTLLAPELLPVPFNGPQITGEGPCNDSMISMTSEDTYVFPEDDSGYCFKIIRNWTIMSWCDVDAMGAPLSFQRQQIIRIVNIDTPVIENTPLEQIVECVQEGDESSFIEVIVSAKNNCTISNNLEWSYAIINTSANPDTIVELSPFELNFGDSIDVSGVYAAGDYRLDFVFRDRCGSEVTGEQAFSVSSDYCYDVEDCVGPLSEVDINLIGCDYPQDVSDLVDVISLVDSGIPNIDCTECIPIDTAFSDILIDSVDELVCDTIRRTLILTFACPFGPNLIVERPHFLVLNNTNNPIIVVPSIPDIVFTASNCEALVDIDLATSMDGCSTGVEITNDSPYADSNNEGDNASGIYPVGNHIVRYTATDLCGNMTVDSIAVSVNDGEAPVCNTQDITLTFFDTDLISINADTLDNFSTDNCVDNEDLIFLVSQSTFSCEDLGDNDLILTVSDGTSSSTCAVTVEILDSIPPICDTQDIVVYLDEDGEVTINAQMVDNGSVTGCQGIFPVSQNVNPSFFNCEDIGDTTILVNGVPQVFFRDTTVFLINVFTSGSFNIDFCQSTVSFIDTFPPICNVMDITVDVGETVEGIDFDNGSTDNCGGSLTFDVDINTFTCDDVDELNSVMVTVTDRFGNAAICEANVTVLDSTYTNFNCLRVMIPMEGDTMVQVLAEQLIDTFQIFNCLGTPVDTAFSYSDTDINDTIQVFGCESVDDFTAIYVFLYIDGVLKDSCVGTVQLLDPLDLCMDGIVGTVDGTVFTSNNEPVSGVLVDLDGSNESIMTDEDGYYAFPEMLGAQAYEVIPTKDDDPMNGVTTLDLILIQRHILGLTDLDSPYDLVAADIDASGTLSVLDILQLRKMILGIYNEFPENKSWRMVDKGFVFWHPDYAEEEEFPETYNIETLISPMKIDFIGVKTGDVNGSVTSSIKQQKDAETRSNNTWNLQATDRYVKAGQSVFVEIAVSEDTEIQGFQLAISTNKIGDISISSSNIQITEDNYSVDKFGVINISWNTINYVQLANGSSVIELEIKPLVDGKLSEMVSISDTGVESQTYLNNEVSYDSAEIFWNTDIGEFALYQNTPNPWTESTDICFKIPIDSEVTINVRSINGQLIKTFNGYYNSGIHSVKLNDEDLIQSGVYYYEMRYGNHVVLEKMILLK